MALGASPGQVLGLVVGQGLRLVALGIGIGLPLAGGITRLLTAFLHGVNPFDPLVFISVSLLLSSIALLACFLPAWRATKVNPITALHAE